MIVQLKINDILSTLFISKNGKLERNQGKQSSIISLHWLHLNKIFKIFGHNSDHHVLFHMVSKLYADLMMSVDHFCPTVDVTFTLKNWYMHYVSLLISYQPFSSSYSSELWHQCITEVQRQPSLFMTSQKRYCVLFHSITNPSTYCIVLLSFLKLSFIRLLKE